MGKRYGYARVSTKGQERDGNSLDDQEAKLRDAGCDVVKREAFTGTTMDRPVLSELLELLEPGDTLVMTKLDRFARTAGEGSAVIKDLVRRGVAVHILNMGLIEDTTMGRLTLTMLLAFAEFERDTIVERLADGKAVEKANNPDYKEGRKALEIPGEFADYREKAAAGEITVVDACAELGISRSTWYKWLKEV